MLHLQAVTNSKDTVFSIFAQRRLEDGIEIWNTSKNKQLLLKVETLKIIIYKFLVNFLNVISCKHSW